MITSNQIDEALAELQTEIRNQLVSVHGPMSDKAVGFMTAISFGFGIKLPDGKTVRAREVQLLLRIGMKPDEILEFIS